MNGMRCGIEDLDRVVRVMTHEGVYSATRDDLSPVMSEMPGRLQIILECDAIYVLSPNEWTVYVFIPVNNSILFEGHTQVMPEGRGEMALASGRKALAYMFTKTPCLKIVGFTPVYNLAALRFHSLLGFQNEGLLTKSYLKDGRLHDMQIVGMTREWWEQNREACG
jgi:hypothetical protein